MPPNDTVSLFGQTAYTESLYPDKRLCVSYFYCKRWNKVKLFSYKLYENRLKTAYNSVISYPKQSHKTYVSLYPDKRLCISYFYCKRWNKVKLFPYKLYENQLKTAYNSVISYPKQSHKTCINRYAQINQSKHLCMIYYLYRWINQKWKKSNNAKILLATSQISTQFTMC